MAHGITTVLGLDVGDRWTHYYAVDPRSGEALGEGRVCTTPAGLQQICGGIERSRVALEVGTHSRWIRDLLVALGHEVLVANARELRFIWQSHNKQDRLDAQKLARVAMLDPAALHPVQHRSAQAHSDLAVLRSRDQLVRARVRLVLMARGMVKATGERLPGCTTRRFAKRMPEHIPEALNPALEPVLRAVAELTRSIKDLEGKIKALAADRYPECRALAQVPGVGTLTALAFVLVLEDPRRFARSREVGPALGLVPRRDQSGEIDRSLGITKCGDGMLRRLLVESAQHILRRRGTDSDLRRWGLAKAAAGGAAKKRAVVAVARKLAVLLHRLWVTQAKYEPLRNAA